mmetsp:Transcript_15592/g.59181  ORF Transcript_15592/g.59181 Transcript_15592/m.59181 type:complete len:241 (-) Transcript_15592:2024-2746(-)
MLSCARRGQLVPWTIGRVGRARPAHTQAHSTAAPAHSVAESARPRRVLAGCGREATGAESTPLPPPQKHSFGGTNVGAVRRRSPNLVGAQGVTRASCGASAVRTRRRALARWRGGRCRACGAARGRGRCCRHRSRPRSRPPSPQRSRRSHTECRCWQGHCHYRAVGGSGRRPRATRRAGCPLSRPRRHSRASRLPPCALVASARESRASGPSREPEPRARRPSPQTSWATAPACPPPPGC